MFVKLIKKKWAFVSDYARFKILYEYGGLYFDTDVELVKSFDDITEKGNFMGCEKDTTFSVAPGLGIGTAPGLKLYEKLLTAYHTRHFLNDDGTYNLKTVVDYTTDMLKKYGLKTGQEIQFVAEVYIYPKEYFCPLNYDSGELNITEKTHSIHHYTATWHNEEESYATLLKQKFLRFLPRKIAVISATAISKAKYGGWHSCIKWIFNKIKE